MRSLSKEKECDIKLGKARNM